MKIGEVAKAAGIGIDAIRFYEREGLVEKPARRPSGYRVYEPDVVHRLRFIRRAKTLGFSLKEACPPCEVSVPSGPHAPAADRLASRGSRSSALVALGVALFLSASAAHAGDVVLRVDGLVCPFCAYGVEKKLLGVPAVSRMDILLEEGRVILRLREGERLDWEALRRAVDEAGFTLRKILVENAEGTLSRNGAGDVLFESSDPLATLRLRAGPDTALPRAEPARGPIRVEVTGEVREFAAEPALLFVTSLRLRDEDQ